MIIYEPNAHIAPASPFTSRLSPSKDCHSHLNLTNSSSFFIASYDTHQILSDSLSHQRALMPQRHSLMSNHTNKKTIPLYVCIIILCSPGPTLEGTRPSVAFSLGFSH